MSSEIEIDDNDLRVLRKVGKTAAMPSAPPRKVGGATVKSRTKGEKPLAHLDGRRNRPSRGEREVPLNVDVPEDVKALVVRARAEFGMPMKTFVAAAIRAHFRTFELDAQADGDDSA